ncbi:hypothetical protein [Bacillus smithii]|uniref:hypothetical protein n=1 Tax=Bacillus smithii TaxID=1479 RepID=UPI003D1A6CF4
MKSKNREREIVIIAPLPNLSERVRLNKLVHLLQNFDSLDITFWGWDRGINSGKKDFEFVNKKIILKGGGEGNKKLIFWYLVWILKVFLLIMFGRKRRYYCLGFESAFPAAAVNLLVKRKFIYDNADNISKVYNWPNFIYKILHCAERFVAKRAFFHIVPGESRIDRIEENTRIVPNTPASFLLDQAKIIATQKKYHRNKKILTVYINGYLTESRGIEQLYKAINICKEDKIKVIVAGYLRCKYAEKLIELPNVEYFGVLSNEEALALYYNSHLCITYYDPTIEINQLAEPNKWGDCLATQTPFITNKEILTAKPYIEKNICWAVPYNDYKALADLLNRLADNFDDWYQYMNNIKKMSYIPWDKAMSYLIHDFVIKN